MDCKMICDECSKPIDPALPYMGGPDGVYHPDCISAIRRRGSTVRGFWINTAGPMIPPARAHSSTVTHVAGLVIITRGRLIQRCALCGEVLVDSKGMAIPTPADGSEPQIATWETGRLVRVGSGNPQSWTLLPHADDLPDDGCFALVE